jgi:DNA-binding transcriptional LysR family regulator
MDFRIRQLQCFLVLAEMLNYGKAARAQHMTQPTLSFQIKSLEQDFGARLFDRDSRGVKLTVAGERLLLSAKRILAEVASVHKQISGMETRAPLRVCCSQAGQFQILPKLIRNLEEIDPTLLLELQPMVPEERVQSLTSGKLDVLMMVAPVDAPGVTFKLLRTESLMAVLPQRAPYTEMKSISVHQFAERPLLVASERECSWCRQFSVAMLRRFGISPTTVDAPIQMNVLFALVAAGKGVAITSEAVVDFKFPGVIYLPFTEAMPRSKLGVAWRTEDDSASLALFRDVLMQTASRSATVTRFPSSPLTACAERPRPLRVNGRDR